MTNNELRDTVAMNVLTHCQGTDKTAVTRAFNIADLFMAERATRGDWNDAPSIKQPERSYIGADKT